MADNISTPAGAVPPKPAEGAKVQPKKETVRISLPPKPTAKETVRLELPPKPTAKETVRLELPPKPMAGVRIPAGAPSLSLVVPQVSGEAKKTVQIPMASPEILTIATPAAPAAPALKTAPPPAPKPAAPAPGKPAVSAGSVAAAAAAAGAAVSARVASVAAAEEAADPVAPVGKSVALPVAAKKKEAVASSPSVVVAPGPARTSVWDIILAVLALITSGAALVRLWMILS